MSPPPITGTTRLFGIVGDPIAQVGSPRLFNALLAERGTDAVLLPFHVAAADLAVWFDGMRRLRNFHGLIVTIPHKFAMLELADAASPRARRVGAANVLRREADGRWTAEMFDGIGAVRALEAKGGGLAGRAARQLGAGGVGRALAFALAEAGVTRLAIEDIDAARRDRLHRDLDAVHPGFVAEGEAASVLVNATPLGSAPSDPPAFDDAALATADCVLDVVLKPPLTRLIETARARGLVTVTGLEMLEGQRDAIADFLGLTA